MKTTVFSPKVDQLIECLRCLPGVGPKSAQRMAFYLLERNRDGGLSLAKILEETMRSVKHCVHCRNFSEETLCRICANEKRDHSLLCIVENPMDVIVIEQTANFHGYYFVLQGHLSPLDGIGPEELGLEQLVSQVQAQKTKEVILATSATVEGEVTAHHIAKLLKPLGISTTRIAHGVPVGGDLEYIDGMTISRALSARVPLIV